VTLEGNVQPLHPRDGDYVEQDYAAAKILIQIAETISPDNTVNHDPDINVVHSKSINCDDDISQSGDGVREELNRNRLQGPFVKDGIYGRDIGTERVKFRACKSQEEWMESAELYAVLTRKRKRPLLDYQHQGLQQREWGKDAGDDDDRAVQGGGNQIDQEGILGGNILGDNVLNEGYGTASIDDGTVQCEGCESDVGAQLTIGLEEWHGWDQDAGESDRAVQGGGNQIDQEGIEGCTNQVVKGGVCWTHGAKVSTRKQCSYEGCTKYVRKGGLCWTHGAKVGSNANNNSTLQPSIDIIPAIPPFQSVNNEDEEERNSWISRSSCTNTANHLSTSIGTNSLSDTTPTTTTTTEEGMEEEEKNHGNVGDRGGDEISRKEATPRPANQEKSANADAAMTEEVNGPTNHASPSDLLPDISIHPDKAIEDDVVDHSDFVVDEFQPYDEPIEGEEYESNDGTKLSNVGVFFSARKEDVTTNHDEQCINPNVSVIPPSTSISAVEETQVDEEEHNDVSNRGGDGPLDFVANNLINSVNPLALYQGNDKEIQGMISEAVSETYQTTTEDTEQGVELADYNQKHYQNYLERIKREGEIQGKADEHNIDVSVLCV
jgi:hypothetical protein